MILRPDAFRVCLVSAALIACALGSETPPSATLADKPLSERVVAYQIDARLDARKKAVDAVETLTYNNVTGKPQDTFPFHMYLNAFQPKSTFMTELKRDHPDFDWE